MKKLFYFLLILIIFTGCKKQQKMMIEITPESGTDIMISNKEPNDNFDMDRIHMINKGVGDTAGINRILLNFIPKEKLDDIKIDSAFLIMYPIVQETHGNTSFYVYQATDTISIRTVWNTQPKVEMDNRVAITLDSAHETEKYNISKLYDSKPGTTYDAFPMILELQDENNSADLTYAPYYSSLTKGSGPKLLIYYK